MAQKARELMQRLPHMTIREGAVINMIAKSTQVDTIRAIYVPERAGKLYRGSRFMTDVHVMIAVRNPKNIFNVEIVKP